MQDFLFAFKHKLVIQFKRNPQKTNMKKVSTVLDGSEKSMIPIIANHGGLLMGSYKRMIPIAEFSAGIGIADIVLCSYDPKIVNKKTTRPITDRRVLEAYMLLLEFSNGLSIKSIHAQLGYGEKELKERILPDLINSGLLDGNSSSYRITKPLESKGLNKVVAVEAKVKDWRSGFRQAMRYQEFADESYLAMYEKHINPCLKYRSAFVTAGIGLIGVSDEGLRVHVPAANVTQYNKDINRLLAHERISTFVDGSNQPFVVREPFAARV